MTKLFRLMARSVPVAVGLAVAGMAVAATTTPGSGDGPVQCEIRKTNANGMTMLEGVVRADIALSGTYQFQVAGRGGGGSSNISQGGYFSAAPGTEVTVGSVMLSNASFDASLELIADGKTIACANDAV
jgi:hypothetical protein